MKGARGVYIGEDNMAYVMLRNGFLCIGTEEEVKGKDYGELCEMIIKALALIQYNSIISATGFTKH